MKFKNNEREIILVPTTVRTSNNLSRVQFIKSENYLKEKKKLSRNTQLWILYEHQKTRSSESSVNPLARNTDGYHLRPESTQPGGALLRASPSPSGVDRRDLSVMSKVSSQWCVCNSALYWIKYLFVPRIVQSRQLVRKPIRDNLLKFAHSELRIQLVSIYLIISLPRLSDKLEELCIKCSRSVWAIRIIQTKKRQAQKFSIGDNCKVAP